NPMIKSNNLMNSALAMQEALKSNAFEGVIPDDVDDDDADAGLVGLRLRIDLRLDDDDDGRVWRGLQVVSELTNAAGDEDADVRLAVDCRERLRVADLRRKLLVGERQQELDHACRSPEAAHVAIVEKRAPVIRAHRLV